VNADNLASLLAELRPEPDSVERAAAIARRFARAADPHLQDTYGWTLFLSGRTEEALPVLETAAAALPSNPVVQYHLAKAYAAAGREEEARAILQMALSPDFRQNFRYLPLIEEALALYVLRER
jgi:predicted Zn-dependent protease